MKNYKIAMIGLNNAKNLGDPLICASTGYLLKQAMKEKGIEGEIAIVDLLPEALKGKKESKKNKQAKNGMKAFLRKFKKLFLVLKEMQLRHGDILGDYVSYYENQLKDSDLVVFAGGGLIKYARQENLNVSIRAAIQVAEGMHIPVAFHACGVEGYDISNPGCKRLKEAINSPAVKVVTTRDDLKTLMECYKEREDLYVAGAADSAVFAGEILGVSKDKNSNVIGIGVIRGNIFENYGKPIQEKQLIEIYGNVCKELMAKNKEFKLFCNGYKPDYLFGQKVCEYAGLGEEYLLERAKDHEELVKQIAGFQGVLAARLHACIISYSLEIPVVGLCWNDKLKHFGKEIGHPDRFLMPEEFSVNTIVDKVLQAMEEGYDAEAVKNYKQTSKDSIEKILISLDEAGKTAF